MRHVGLAGINCDVCISASHSTKVLRNFVFTSLATSTQIRALYSMAHVQVHELDGDPAILKTREQWAAQGKLWDIPCLRVVQTQPSKEQVGKATPARTPAAKDQPAAAVASFVETLTNAIARGPAPAGVSASVMQPEAQPPDIKQYAAMVEFSPDLGKENNIIKNSKRKVRKYISRLAPDITTLSLSRYS